MKQPFDLPLHHLKFLDLAVLPGCFLSQEQQRAVAVGFAWGRMSWPFPEMIHYSLLSARAGSEPSTARAKPDLLCVPFAFLSVRLHLTPHRSAQLLHKSPHLRS